MKKIAIIISGCGVYDGAEIHETVLTMLAATKLGVSYQLYAPNSDQMHVVNHLNGEVMREKRNILIEAARIARGKIKDLKEYKHKNYDAIVFPGGFGVAKNFCSFAVDGNEMKVIPEIEQLIIETHKASKPIGAMCISPVLIAKLIKNSKLTIGKDNATAETIRYFGSEHIDTTNTEIVVDEKNKIATTPCYMLDSNIYQISQGAENLIKALIELM